MQIRELSTLRERKIKMNTANMKIGTRLGFSFGSVCVLLLIIVGIGVSQLSVLNDGTSDITHNKWPKISMVSQALRIWPKITSGLRAEWGEAKSVVG